MSIELRVKQAKSISNGWNLEFRGIPNRHGNWITEVGLMLEVTRGQVDNENNNQSQYSNILNMGGGLYIHVREHSHVTSHNTHVTLLTNLG